VIKWNLEGKYWTSFSKMKKFIDENSRLIKETFAFSMVNLNSSNQDFLSYADMSEHLQVLTDKKQQKDESN